MEFTVGQQAPDNNAFVTSPAGQRLLLGSCRLQCTGQQPKYPALLRRDWRSHSCRSKAPALLCVALFRAGDVDVSLAETALAVA